MPPCDWKPSHQPEVCDFYYCRDADNSGPPQRECQFLGNCQGDSQCEKTASFLGLDPNSSYLSDTADYTTDYSTADSSNNAYYAAEYAATDSPTSVKSSVSDSSVGTGTSTADNNGAQVSANWAAYAILGGVLTAFLMIVIWRKRVSIFAMSFYAVNKVPQANDTISCIFFRPKLIMINWERSCSLMARTSMVPLQDITRKLKGAMRWLNIKTNQPSALNMRNSFITVTCKFEENNSRTSPLS
jgi:hypothetical protein